MHLPPDSPAVTPQPSLEAQHERIEILTAFADPPEVRKASGKRHHMAPCLALFTPAVTAGHRGFLSIGDWLKCYQRDLIDLFNPPKHRLPSHSTIRRVLLKLDYGQYSAALARFYRDSLLHRPSLRIGGIVCWAHSGLLSAGYSQCKIFLLVK